MALATLLHAHARVQAYRYVCYAVPLLRDDTRCRGWELLDWDKNKGGARCSDTWEYGGEAAGGGAAAGGVAGLDAQAARPRRKVPQPPETGALRGSCWDR